MRKKPADARLAKGKTISGLSKFRKQLLEYY